jgi:hypothetical protein
VTVAYGVTPARFDVLQRALPPQAGITTTVLLGRFPEETTSCWTSLALLRLSLEGDPYGA